MGASYYIGVAGIVWEKQDAFPTPSHSSATIFLMPPSVQGWARYSQSHPDLYLPPFPNATGYTVGQYRRASITPLHTPHPIRRTGLDSDHKLDNIYCVL